MGESDQPPDDGERQPRQDEAEGEDDQGPSPLGVHECCEDVLQETQTPLGDSRFENVALSVLEHGPSPQFARSMPVLGSTSETKNYLYKYLS